MAKDRMSLIQDFFYKNDEFLKAQFAQALGAHEAKSVQDVYSELVEFTRALNFGDARFSSAKEKWLAIFDSVPVHLGFEALRNLSSVQNKSEHLIACRDGIDSSSFIDTLRSYSAVPFASDGLGLEVSPNEWLMSKDVPLAVEPDPQEFKAQLFLASGFEPAFQADYVFKNSRSGFFMMALYLEAKFFIGYGPINSLFGLSALAHEIGHTTTHRERDLEKEFLVFPETLKGALIHSNEHDSYRYEFIFMQKVSELTSALGVSSDIEVAERLFKRKAIQNNMHLLKNRMNFSYFSGLPLNEISESFLDQILKIYPGYRQVSEFDWLNYSTLDQPLSRIGYLEAYPRTFGEA